MPLPSPPPQTILLPFASHTKALQPPQTQKNLGGIERRHVQHPDFFTKSPARSFLGKTPNDKHINHALKKSKMNDELCGQSLSSNPVTESKACTGAQGVL